MLKIVEDFYNVVLDCQKSAVYFSKDETKLWHDYKMGLKNDQAEFSNLLSSIAKKRPAIEKALTKIQNTEFYRACEELLNSSADSWGHLFGGLVSFENSHFLKKDTISFLDPNSFSNKTFSKPILNLDYEDILKINKNFETVIKREYESKLEETRDLTKKVESINNKIEKNNKLCNKINNWLGTEKKNINIKDEKFVDKYF